MKRATSIVLGIAALFYVASLFVESPPICEQCGYVMNPHERNDHVYVCPKCGDMVDVTRARGR